MSTRNVLKNFNTFVDGRGFAGQCEEFTPPDLALVTDKVRLGGMDAPVAIDNGMEELTCSASFIGVDPDLLRSFGVTQGSFVPLVARGALEDWTGQVKSVVHTCRGKVTKLSQGSYKAGEKAPVKLEMSLVFYSLTHDGVPIHLIDVQNMVRLINGVDVLLAQRKALGI